MAAPLFAGELPGWSVDPELGHPFMVRTIDGEFHSTLIHYTPDDIPSEDSTAARKPKAQILYVHGFNDYFFQRELAQKADSAGYTFFAIDLHKYGRSLREGERIGELTDIREYFAELDSAITFMKSFNADMPIVLLGHSTGGLIVTLYAKLQSSDKDIEAIVLNSPFYELNYSKFILNFAVPVLTLLGGIFPDIDIPRSQKTMYSESIHKSYRGEWVYNLDVKHLASIPVNLAWLRAIHKAQLEVQEGLKLEQPVLIMHSSCSIDTTVWVDEHTHCDAVLNVKDIRRYGAFIGPDVTLFEVEGGLHDLLLSRKPSRDKAYQVMFNFLDHKVK
ncbi:MAG: alpha/beta hydrolase [Fibrobacter sp.]|nr:alpha/beta hydrolase [Fibrobacter sp.]